MKKNISKLMAIIGIISIGINIYQYSIIKNQNENDMIMFEQNIQMFISLDLEYSAGTNDDNTVYERKITYISQALATSYRLDVKSAYSDKNRNESLSYLIQNITNILLKDTNKMNELEENETFLNLMREISRNPKDIDKIKELNNMLSI